MNWSRIAGWIAIAFGVVHIVVAQLERRDIWSQAAADGLWNTFTLEPTTPSETQRSSVTGGVQPAMGQASHDFSDDALAVAAANLLRAGS